MTEQTGIVTIRSHRSQNTFGRKHGFVWTRQIALIRAAATIAYSNSA